MVPTAVSINYSCTQPSLPSGRKPAGNVQYHAWRKREDACARERRIFGSCEGGSGGDGEGESEAIKKGMLDVVLGLFDGLDYDDEGLC